MYGILEGFVRKRGLGTVFPSDTGYVLARQPGTMRGPDVSFVSKDRSEVLDLDRNIDGGPDLAVQVVSENDTARIYRRRSTSIWRRALMRFGSSIPETREVHLFEANGTVRRLMPAHSLGAPNLLPGFSHRIAGLFDE